MNVPTTINVEIISGNKLYNGVLCYFYYDLKQ